MDGAKLQMRARRGGRGGGQCSEGDRKLDLTNNVGKVVAKMTSGTRGCTLNKIERKSQWHKLGSLSKKQVVGVRDGYVMLKTLLTILLWRDKKLGATASLI